ncbi:hypothetical protein Tco_0766158 [Tanacetum coccineum]
MTTVGTRAVVNTGKGKLNTDLKRSRWVWRPKGNYLDHVSKDSGSFMLKKGNPEILLQDHAVVDSGCSSHMTGNKAYLSDYEDFNGGFVAFGSDPKGGKITGKGKIKTANLDFDDVYFVDELNFKLLDESQVVLRAPRKDDVYSLDLKNIVPSRGTQDSYVAGSSGKDKGPTLEYILLPLQPHRTRILVEDVPPVAPEKPSKSSPKANDVQDSEDAANKESLYSTDSLTQPYFSAASTCPQFKIADASDTLILLPNDGIFNKSYDDDKEWVQWPGFQQHGNTNCCQSLFPTLRIHKIIQKKNSKDPTTQFKQEEDSKGFFSTNKPDKYTSQYRSNKSQDQAKTIGCMFSLSKNPRLITILYKRKAWLKQMHENCFIQTTEGLVLVDLPYRKSNWAHKWGHQIKRDERSIVCEKTKARLVAQGLDRRKTIVANSTTEAEYVAAANCCGQVLWIQNQMMDYGFNFMNTKIHIDNESTISVIKNPVAHSRTKHIEIRFHFIRDCYEKRLIEVIKIHTDSNVADLLTKGFDVTRFNFLVVSIGMISMDLRMDRCSAGKFYSYMVWDFVPLMPTMLAGAAMDPGEGLAQPAEPHHTLVDPLPSTSLPPHSPYQSPPQSPPHSPH